MHRGNGLKFCTLMHLDHLQNWLVYGYGLLIFLIWAQFWLSETGQNLGFPCISQRTHRGNDLKFCTLMYLDHLQKWLVYGHGLLIFLILALFWLEWNGSNLGFPGISRRKHGGNGLKCCMLMYLDHFQNWLVYGHSLLILLILALFLLSETGQIWGFRAFPRERIEEMT